MLRRTGKGGGGLSLLACTPFGLLLQQGPFLSLLRGLCNGATLVAKFRCYEIHIGSRRQAGLKVF
jgi:hypothetical protein